MSSYEDDDSQEARRKERNKQSRQRTIQEAERLLVEGKKKLEKKDFEEAVEVLSKAARSASMGYERYAPDAYGYYLLYARALLGLAAGQLKAKRSGSNKRNLSMLERGHDELNHTLEHNIKDLLIVLEGAEEICGKQLENTGGEFAEDLGREAEHQEWVMKMNELLYFRGHALILKGKSTCAGTNLIKAVEIKEKCSTDKLVLATDFKDIAIALEEVLDFANAKIYFEKALSSFKNVIETIKVSGGNSGKLNAIYKICENIQEKINTIEAGMLSIGSKDQTVDMSVDDSNLVTHVDSGFGNTRSISPIKRPTSGFGDSMGLKRKKQKKH